MSDMRFKNFTIDSLKYAPWLTGERVALWAAAFSVTWIGVLAWDALTLGLTNAAGDHLGRDFVHFWSGARLAMQGRASMAYNTDFFGEFQRWSVAGSASVWNLYGYPPVALLLTLPLAGLPYIPALILWSALGVLLCAFTIQRHTGWRWAWMATFGPPAAFLNLFSGQNGYFTAVLLAGGLVLVERRPATAGILLGMLCYKPQMGILVPVALLAGAHWRAFLSATTMVSLLVLASAILLGPDTWTGFFGQAPLTRDMMETAGRGIWHRMPTVFCAMRLLGANLAVAYGIQAISTLLAGAAVVFLWRKSCALNIRVAALGLAAFLATPYAWDYDMIILTFVVVLLVQEARQTGFLPWEKIMWLAVVVLPVPMMAVAALWGLPLGPLVLWPALLLVLRRGMAQAEGEAPSQTQRRI
jgi:arabinofuranan 3-O-arabinosyltransferase